MEKKGQITVFIVLGILIVVSIALLLFYSQSRILPDGKEQAETNQIMSPLKSQIDYCLEKSLEDTIFFVGMQGGYYYSPAKTEELLLTDIPYYYYEGESLTPDKEEMERQLSLGVRNVLPKCLDDVKEFFNKTGVEFKYEIKLLDVAIREEKVILNSIVPVKVYYKMEDNKDLLNYERLSDISTDITTIAELSDFSVELDLEYNKVIDWSKEIVQLQAKYPQTFPLSKITDLAYDEGFKIEIIAPEEVSYGEGENSNEDKEFENIEKNQNNKVIVSILDDKIFDRPYYFSFGILYDIDIENHFKDDIELEQEYKEMTAKG
jgi:hypothetical protein